jgi:hypothetical protein
VGWWRHSCFGQRAGRSGSVHLTGVDSWSIFSCETRVAYSLGSIWIAIFFAAVVPDYLGTNISLRMAGRPEHRKQRLSKQRSSKQETSRQGSSTTGSDFTPPPKRLGRLVATADSIFPTLTLSIYGSFSWGRHRNSTVVYRDEFDVRIPRTAFILVWYSPRGEVYDKTAMKMAICTRATHGIMVNDQHLQQRDTRNRILYGDLCTGDVIEVYSNDCQTKYLRFECEFYAGSSRQPRKSVGKFRVRS